MADGGSTIISLVWCVCAWTDLWRMVALKTDQVMEEKLKASGFIPGWFMTHMMVSAESVWQTLASCLSCSALLKDISMTCLTFTCVLDLIRSHCESMCLF